MNKIISMILAISLLLAASSIFYYFAMVLPGIREQEQALKQEEVFQKQREVDQKKIDLDNCLLDAQAEQKKDAQILNQLMFKIGCQDSVGNVVQTKGCYDALVHSFDELKLDYSNAEVACYSRFN